MNTHFIQYLRRFSWKKNNCELRNLTYGTDINLPIKLVIIFLLKSNDAELFRLVQIYIFLPKEVCKKFNVFGIKTFLCFRLLTGHSIAYFHDGSSQEIKKKFI
jgi:hypothetical protein